MSHEITQTNGRYEMAFTGSRDAVWHGLGQQLTEDATIDVWKEQAGMNWMADSARLQFAAGAFNDQGAMVLSEVPEKKVLYRSDNKEVLGIVGEDYKVVQPGQVLEFFDDLTRIHGMKLSTAGTLFGGKRFWALAKVAGAVAEVVPNDEVDAYLLLVTAVDGTMSTHAHYTSTRVVCNNTLNVAMHGTKKSLVKFTHHKEWDPTKVKIDMGLLGESWSDYIGNLRKLASIKMDEKATRLMYQKIFFDPKKGAEEQGLAALRVVDTLMNRAFEGIGSDMSKGTAWGALNGATELFTHWTGKRDASRQFWDSYIGDYAVKKEEVYRQLLEIA